MDNSPKAPTSIDEYIAAYPDDIRTRLEAIRRTISAAAPDAAETISYGMPAFRLNGVLVYFGVGKEHIGFYPTPSGIAAFKDRLAAFHSGKGSVQFPNTQPIPFDLIADIVKFRVTENSTK